MVVPSLTAPKAPDDDDGGGKPTTTPSASDDPTSGDPTSDDPTSEDPTSDDPTTAEDTPTEPTNPDEGAQSVSEGPGADGKSPAADDLPSGPPLTDTAAEVVPLPLYEATRIGSVYDQVAPAYYPVRLYLHNYFLSVS